MKNAFIRLFNIFIVTLITSMLFNINVAKAYSNISSLEVYEIINKKSSSAIIIDVRTPEEYKTGYIPKSINIPIQILKDEILKKNIDKNAKIILYCRSGIRSRKAAEILESLGYNNLFLLGGILDWPYELAK